MDVQLELVNENTEAKPSEMLGSLMLSQLKIGNVVLI